MALVVDRHRQEWQARLHKAMEMALESGPPEAAEVVATECVVLAETKDHLNWELIGMLAGVWIAAQLAWPALNFDIPWLTYGRLRPLHTNAVIFALPLNTTPCPGITVSKSTAFNFSSVAIHSSGNESPM